ncbi:LysR family transcriptional regulator [Mycetocola tolaasinivorans]|uniref:LysR family transcriptional regulator n=1 Tax=Mycetocola tolaasinivorans TaxID=76635 RepID=A0A3L7A2V3_9MICO|nr:LysR family transcriptional regulator [Mycetocola tolaasinivorans]RLP74507.1 LysR family transcriptional regulator [Mycetocola tolaasinivorans]
MSEISLRQLEYLVATAEAGSVTAAAQRLFLSQSALSGALSSLENTLGVQIFLRHPRGISLTNSGQEILVDARRLLSGVEDLQNRARENTEELTGTLTIGCFTPILLPGAITEFVRRHPEVELNFVEGSQNELEEQLRRGILDMAILYDYGDGIGQQRIAAGLTTQTVLETLPYVILPEGHPLTAAESLSLADLADEPMILFNLPPGGEYFLTLFRQAEVEPNIRFRTTSFEMVRALVSRGLGYSILNQRTSISTSYEGLGFVTRPLRGNAERLDVIAAHLMGARLSRRAQAFIDQCRETAREMHRPPLT